MYHVMYLTHQVHAFELQFTIVCTIDWTFFSICEVADVIDLSFVVHFDVYRSFIPHSLQLQPIMDTDYEKLDIHSTSPLLHHRLSNSNLNQHFSTSLHDSTILPNSAPLEPLESNIIDTEGQQQKTTPEGKPRGIIS